VKPRTLPLRIAPIPGEALDSWLEAHAYRYRLPLRNIMTCNEIDHRLRAEWTISLSARQVQNLETTTGLDAPRIKAMTLSRYDGVALDVADVTSRRAPTFPWGALKRSRYCPECLVESGGRWQLSWRLSWSFACATHRSLLLDTCSACGGNQRAKPQATRYTPQLGHCTSGGAQSRTDCRANLTSTDIIKLRDDHPLLVAQQTVNAIIRTNRADFGIYTNQNCEARSALTDISILAARTLAHANLLGLNPKDATDFIDAYLGATPPSALTWPSFNYRPRTRPPSTAIEAAVGVAAALQILRQDTITAAGEAMRWLAPKIEPGVHSSRGLSWGLRGSTVLAAIQVKSYTSRLSAALQLRHRAALPTPIAPHDDKTKTTRIVDRLPSALWPAFSIRLRPRGYWDRRRKLRPTLSCAILLTATKLTKAEAAAALGILDESALNYELMRLRATASWPHINIALARIADHLNTNPSPIDYDRRRHLDYTSMLPTSRWLQICWATDTLTGGPLGAEIARRVLLEEISGGLQLAYPRAPQRSKRHNYLNSCVNDFPLRLTPDLVEQLREEAACFLTRHHIDEPTTWHPPLALLADLDVPNGDVDRIPIDELHRAASAANVTTGQVARSVGSDIDTVRYLLSVHPIDRRGDHNEYTLPTPARWDRKALTPDMLNTLHSGQGLSVTAIAKRFGVTCEHINRLAKNHNVTLRGGQPRPSRDYLVGQYVVRRRSIDDIADEFAVSTRTARGWIIDDRLDVDQVPLSKVSDTMTTESAWNFLRPALMRPAGKAMLDAFYTASKYATLADAASITGVKRQTLDSQLRVLEDVFGDRLMTRATPARERAATSLGEAVLAAYHVLADGIDKLDQEGSLNPNVHCPLPPSGDACRPSSLRR
jgi:hypothetical protein